MLNRDDVSTIYCFSVRDTAVKIRVSRFCVTGTTLPTWTMPRSYCRRPSFYHWSFQMYLKESVGRGRCDGRLHFDNTLSCARCNTFLEKWSKIQ